MFVILAIEFEIYKDLRDSKSTCYCDENDIKLECRIIEKKNIANRKI